MEFSGGLGEVNERLPEEGGLKGCAGFWIQGEGSGGVVWFLVVISVLVLTFIPSFFLNK